MADLAELPEHPEVEVSSSKCCAFFLKQKGRSCRLIATRNSRFCPEHLLNAGGEGTWIIIIKHNI